MIVQHICRRTLLGASLLGSVIAGSTGLPVRTAGLAGESGQPAVVGVPGGPTGSLTEDLRQLDAATIDPGRILVQLRYGFTTGTLLADFSEAFGGGSPSSIVPFAGPSTAVLTLRPGVDVATALSWLSARPEVAYAEPDFLLHGLSTPNDPLFATDQQYLAYMHLPEAWDLQTGDPSIVVAVLDSGVDLSHPDLAGNIWTNPNAGAGDCGLDLHGCNFVAAATSSVCPPGSAVHTPDVTPLSWHGTFVAGIIGARGNNGMGIAGVAWNVALLPVRMANCRNTADTTALVNAVHYAVDQGARIIDISSGTGRSAGAGCRTPSRFMADAVQYARDHGVLVVAGTGNENKGCVSDPAAAPGALAVGGLKLPDATRWSTSRTGPGSNWGPEVMVAAPANDIVSTMLFNPLLKPPNDRYGSASGTSFAAPLVAGEAALLLSQNALLTPDWLTTLIALGAHALPDGPTPNWAGAGSVDVAASLRLVPAGYYGSVGVDGAPAPDGTLVEAFVGGNLCAQSAAYVAGDRTLYQLMVPANAMQAGCGVPGALVDLRVDGIAAAQVAWSPVARAADLNVNESATPGP